MRAVRRHRSAGAVLRAATVALSTRRLSSVPSKERRRVAACGPENTPQQPALRFATYGVQIIRAKRSCNRLRCREGCAPNRALGRSAECALRRPLWRIGGVLCGTDGMRSTYARARSSSTWLCAWCASSDRSTVASLPNRAARRRRPCPKAWPAAGSKRSGEHGRRRARRQHHRRDGGHTPSRHPPSHARSAGPRRGTDFE